MKKQKVFYIDVPLGYERVMLYSAKTVDEALKEVLDLRNNTAYYYAEDCYPLLDRIDDAVRDLHDDILLGSADADFNENDELEDVDWCTELTLGKLGLSA